MEEEDYRDEQLEARLRQLEIDVEQLFQRLQQLKSEHITEINYKLN